MIATPIAPVRSAEQRDKALALANLTRTYRANLKRRVADDWQVASQSLTSGDELIQSMKVFDLLMAVRPFGLVKVRRLMREAGCSESKTIGGLSKRQRAVLVLRLARMRNGGRAARCPECGRSAGPVGGQGERA